MMMELASDDGTVVSDDGTVVRDDRTVPPVLMWKTLPSHYHPTMMAEAGGHKYLMC